MQLRTLLLCPLWVLAPASGRGLSSNKHEKLHVRWAKDVGRKIRSQNEKLKVEQITHPLGAAQTNEQSEKAGGKKTVNTRDVGLHAGKLKKKEESNDV